MALPYAVMPSGTLPAIWSAQTVSALPARRCASSLTDADDREESGAPHRPRLRRNYRIRLAMVFAPF